MTIFAENHEHHEFLRLLAAVFAAHDVDCHAYCLMSNHYHVVIRTNQGNLSRALKEVNSGYAMWWNSRHSRPGHVFQGRFGAQVIQDESYLLTVVRYVVLNPVRAGLVILPEQWPWSSYRATAGLAPVLPFLQPDIIWHQLGSGDLESSCRRYREFVAGDGGSQPLPYDSILGDEAFVQRFKDERSVASSEVPKRQRRTVAPLGEYFAGAFTAAGKTAGATAARAAGYTLGEIGAFLGVHYTTVSKMTRHAG